MTTTKPEKGLFITFEGVEGGGKTTNISFVTEIIRKSGRQILITREPGGTSIGEAIRNILISKEYPEMHYITELLLMFAARSEHIQRKIRPALEQGIWVLCDRFTDASYAYQGAGRGVDSEKIKLLENLVQESLRPDITFLFDLEANIGLARAQSRGETDRFEQQHIDFFNRVRSKYLEMAKAEPQRYRIIEAQHALKQVQQQVSEKLEEILQK